MPQEKVQNAGKTLVRQLMPVVYSLIAAFIARLGYHVSLLSVAKIIGVGTVGLNVVLVPLERKWPWFGAILGWLGAPTYTPTVSKAALLGRIAELESRDNHPTSQVSTASSGAPVVDAVAVSTPAPAEPLQVP